MKILCVSYEYPPIGGGGAPFCEGLNEALVRLGHEVDVVTSGMADLSPFETRAGVRIYRVPCIRRYRHYCSLPELASQIYPSLRKAVELTRTSSYDINHTHFVVPSGVVSYLLKRRTGLPYVLTAHGSDVPGYNPDRFRLTHRVIRPAWKRILNSSAALHTPSKFLRDLILEQIEGKDVTLIPYGFELPLQDATDEPVERRNRILVVTRMFERKGVQFLIRALEGLGLTWEVCVAGDGPYLPTLRELAAKLAVPVRFFGFVSGESLRDLYRSARIFVFPSVQENFPVVLLEAMAHGCAVITTSADGCREVVGDAALMIPPGDVEAIRSALHQLLADKDQVARLARLGREQVRRFVWDRVATEYEALYRCAME